MYIRLLILLLIVLASFGMLSLVVPDNRVEVPMKKIHKAIKKVWKVERFEVIDDDLNNARNCSKQGCWMMVKSSGENLGSVYIGRVNSCRSGGCSVDMNAESLAFEFFDYFLLTDPQGEVLWVKVFNYQATQGHEVMSRGWLNQFNGLATGQVLVFGDDIESISGATVSASAITEDIQNVLSCLSPN